MENRSDSSQSISIIIPDISGFDDVRYDFGNLREDCLAKALALISTGRISLGRNKNVLASKIESINSLKIVALKQNIQFQGMIENRLKFKK